MRSQNFFLYSNPLGSDTGISFRTFSPSDHDMHFAIFSAAGIFPLVLHHNQRWIHHVCCPCFCSSKTSLAYKDRENSFLGDIAIASQKNQVQRNQSEAWTRSRNFISIITWFEGPLHAGIHAPHGARTGRCELVRYFSILLMLVLRFQNFLVWCGF